MVCGLRMWFRSQNNAGKAWKRPLQLRAATGPSAVVNPRKKQAASYIMAAAVMRLLDEPANTVREHIFVLL